MDMTERAALALRDGDERGDARKAKMKAELSTRLSIAEGQIRGIKGLIDKDACCDDVLTQLAAARAALKSVSMLVLQNHIQKCVAKRVTDGEDKAMDELLVTINRIL